MDFFEKLKRRAAEINKSKAGIAAGLKANTISSYLAKRSTPRADIAFKIARALDVPLEWLLDDAQGWPPPRIDKPTPATLSDEELMGEIRRRYRLQAVRLYSALERAEKIDWIAIAKQLLSLAPNDQWPSEIAPDLRLRESMSFLLLELFNYDTWHGGDQIPRRDIPDEELAPDRLRGRMERLLVEQPAFDGVGELLNALRDQSVYRNARIEGGRQRLEEALSGQRRSPPHPIASGQVFAGKINLSGQMNLPKNVNLTTDIPELAHPPKKNQPSKAHRTRRK